MTGSEVYKVIQVSVKSSNLDTLTAKIEKWMPVKKKKKLTNLGNLSMLMNT